MSLGPDTGRSAFPINEALGQPLLRAVADQARHMPRPSTRRWAAGILALAATLLSAPAAGQIDGDVKATMLRQGFTEADFRHLAAAEQPPHRALISSWLGCIQSKVSVYLASDWTIAKAFDATRFLCSDKEAALLTSMAATMGEAPARRVIELVMASGQIAAERGAERRRALPATPAKPSRAIPPDQDFTGKWAFSRGKDGSCTAALTYDVAAIPDVYVNRDRDHYTIVLRQRFETGSWSKPTDPREVIFYYGQRTIDRTIAFVADKDADDPLLLLSVSPDEIDTWRNATWLWVGPRGNESDMYTSFKWYSLNDFAVTLTRLDWCIK